MSTDASTALVTQPVDPYQALVEKPLYDQIDPQQLAVIKSNVAKGLSDPEVAYFLELARSLGLNPWAKEIWAAKGDGANASLLIMVGRDGLLRKAEEFPDYLGYDAGVVYEGDEFFFADPDASGATLRERAGISHRSNPAGQGKVLGAWACAERRGRPVRRFFARLEEYMPKSEKKVQYSPWGSAVSIMIEKVAISVVHRTLCNISGVYLQEEVDRALSTSSDGGLTRGEEWTQIMSIVEELECPAETRDRLLVGMGRMNELSPGSWGLAKVQMTLPGRTAAELAAQADQIEADIAREEAGRVALVTREPEPEPEPVDAVVVEDEDAEAAADVALEDGVDETLVALDELAEDQLHDPELLRERLQGLYDRRAVAVEPEPEVEAAIESIEARLTELAE